MEIIAEIGQNHNGDMGLAIELIRSAKENGADVAKFQLYDAKSLFPKEGNEWYDYNCKTELSREQVNLLASECSDVGIEFMVSVFDLPRIEWAEDVGVKRYKLASRSVNEKALISAFVNTNKPLIVSLGMWSENDFPVIEAPAGVEFLYCVSKYPTPLTELNLSKVDFSKYAGFSDHTIGITAPIAALSRGARILEKHFTLDKNMYGPDHTGSMTPDELLQISTFKNELAECL